MVISLLMCCEMKEMKGICDFGGGSEESSIRFVVWVRNYLGTPVGVRVRDFSLLARVRY